MQELRVERVSLLIQQGRAQEAIKELKNYLENTPDDYYAQYLLAFAYYTNNDLNLARKVTETILEIHPDFEEVIYLLANIDLADDKDDDAELKANLLLKIDPENSDFHLLLAKIKFSKRYYDLAFSILNEALALDPDNIEALNLKATVADLIGDKSAVNISVDSLLEKDPENPTSIANDGLRLLKQQKVEAALERFKDALAIQPQNQLARYGMQEALKSKFWIYRMFYRYGTWTSKMDSKQSWMFFIGSYIVYRGLASLASKSDGTLQIALYGIVVLIALSFFLSWIINPLMNVYLLSNKYGKILLERDDEIMAKATAASFALSIISLTTFAVFRIESLLYLAILFFIFMIPSGTFLQPQTKAKQNKLKYFALGILVFGILGAFFSMPVLTLAFVGTLIYQFYFNSLMINDFSRKFE